MIKIQKTYRHSGDMGDIIYSLPVVKKNGLGIFLIDQNLKESEERIKRILQPGMDIFFNWGKSGGMRDWKYNFIKPLLTKQYYIENVKNYDGENIFCDLDNFRIDKGDNCIYYKYINIFKLDPNSYDDPWLSADKKQIAKTIVSRTSRYNNYYFPWEKIIKKYSDLIFIGLDEEYNNFVKNFGYIPRYNVADAWELACVINGADLFVGNQSLAYAIAEGLKKDTIQETCQRLPDCIFPRDNAFYYINNKFAKLQYYDL